ncbi:helix-turn-helix domain-containing protein [Pseudonocardia kongjuensis]|uniref:Helix-turn-helix domain-containing protein n=2 Tax=Pseudonocardia kongjuensis TaxID=102227 RepID=A0ABP4IH84_9PSEU
MLLMGRPPGTGAGPAQGAVTFSTEGIAPQRRVRLWEQHLSSFVGVACLRTGNLPVAEVVDTVVSRRLPRIHVARVAWGPQVIRRSPARIAASPTAAVLLSVTLAGESFLYHRDGVHMLGVGDAVAVDADRPFLRGFPRGLTELVVKLPYAVFEEFVGVPVPRSPLFAAGGAPVADVLAGALDESLRAADRPDAETAVLHRVHSAFARAPEPGPVTTFDDACAFIDAHVDDSRLSVDRVAAGVGISARQLARVFRQHRTTVGRSIMDRRLDGARRLLLAEGNERMPVREVARRSGFLSAAHFARAFRARFGMTPTGLRDSGGMPDA